MKNLEKPGITTVIAVKYRFLKMANPEELGKFILFHRKKSGLSQEDLAKLGGLGKTAVFDLEKGKMSVQFDKLLKVPHVLNIKIGFSSYRTI